MRKLLRSIVGVFAAPRYPPAYEPVHMCAVLSADRNYFSADILRRAGRNNAE